MTNPSSHPSSGDGDQTKGRPSRDTTDEVQRYRIAHNALALAAVRSIGCIFHADGHDHGDTHCVVRVDDLVVLIEETYRTSDFEVSLALAQSALDGVLAALDTADIKGEPPSVMVLRGILSVYAKAEEQ